MLVKSCIYTVVLSKSNFNIRLSMFGVLFQKVGPIYDKANWPVLISLNGYFSFNSKLFSIATLKGTVHWNT